MMRRKEVILYIVMFSFLALCYVLNGTTYFIKNEIQGKLENATNLRRRSTINLFQQNVSNRSRLLCFISISYAKKRDEIRRLAKMWTSNCDQSIFFSFPNSIYARDKLKNMNIVFLNITENGNGQWMKTITSLNHIYMHYLKEFDWFLAAHDDTYVNSESLRNFLGQFDSSAEHFFSYAWPGLLKTGHKGSYVLSQSSLAWLVEEGIPNKTLCSQFDHNWQVIGSERLRWCFKKIGIFSGIDARFHRAFIPQQSYFSNESEKLILVWNDFIHRDLPKLTLRHSENCPVKCTVSSDKGLFDEAHAILFHVHQEDDKTWQDLPAVRHAWQRYVHINVESHGGGIAGGKGILFNWSMTYHRDSDVRFDYYGQFLRHTQSSSQRDFVRNTVLKKSRMIAWLVSYCDVASARLEYANELRDYISIDQFGCLPSWINFTHSYNCPRNAEHYGYWCSDIPFTTDYRFYLSFENSVCRDYVTEKFYQALDQLMVPIVLRNADYVDIAPSGSYIAADQFRSPKDLANYLHYLASNPEEYLKYFDYTKTNTVVWKENQMLEDGLCRLCRMLHENRTKSSGYDMAAIWSKTSACVDLFARQLL